MHPGLYILKVKQLLDKAEYDMKNYETNNCLHNSPYDTNVLHAYM